MSAARLSARILVPVLLALGLVGGSVPLARAADSPEQQLADRYAPVVVVRDHPIACADGEPYLPVPVDVVFGKPDVTLVGPDGSVVKTAPTAADLAGRGEGYYLDLPGNPLNPGCEFETWFEANTKGVRPAVYARVATEPGKPGRLALQYWFYWTYNDWNDKHEGDWEMVQLLFDADTAAEALTRQPTDSMYAQHEGGETAAWSAGKVLRDGDHPAVYPGQGSHAAYYTQARWFGKSAAAGFGCDNTSVPGVEVRPDVVLLPPGAPTTGPFAWLSFTGRWGEKEPSFNNGPTGPNTKTQWTEPITWFEEEGRPGAVALTPLPGPAVTSFCSLTSSGSLLFIALLDSPWLVLGLIVVAVALLWWALTRTTWRHGFARPVDAMRSAGRIVTSAVRVWLHHVPTFGLLGLVLLGGWAVAAVLQSWILAGSPTGNLADVMGRSSGWSAVMALLAGAVVTVPVTVVVAAAVARATGALAAEQDRGPVHALGAALRHPASAITAFVQQTVPALLAATIVLLPVAAWLVSRWAAAFPAAAVEDLGVGASLSRSSALTRGHRWRTLWLTLMLGFLATAIGPFVGALALLATGWSFGATNLVAGAVNAVLTPVASIGLVLQFLDLRQRAAGTAPQPEQVAAGAG